MQYVNSTSRYKAYWDSRTVETFNIKKLKKELIKAIKYGNTQDKQILTDELKLR